MRICIAGWYFWPEFLLTIGCSIYDAFVIKHREGETQHIPSQLYPNLGLEFGAYKQYVEHHWDGESDVLFLHDDADLKIDDALDDICQLRKLGVEQAYIFPDEIHEHWNGGIHGRGIWIRGDILRKLQHDFPADMTNAGVNIGEVAQKGVHEFHRRILECGHNTGVIAIVPQLRFAHRGKLHHKMFVYRRVSAVPGGLVNA